MKRTVLRKIAVACAMWSAASSVSAQISVSQPIPRVATIDVNAAETGHTPIPRTIFGTFLEPIGNSTYNGLWAELLQNPSLETGLWSPSRTAQMIQEDSALRQASDLDLPLPWEPVNPRQGNRYEMRYGDAVNSWQSLRVFAVPGEPTGIRQKVYLPIHRTRRYVGSFYARHVSGDTEITIALRPRDQDEILVAQTVPVEDENWTKYTFSLEVPAGKLHRLDPADFVVELKGKERVDLDEFSLMPVDAANGLDPDVVALASAMRTPLVRFGGNFTSSYHWKNGVGERDKRVSEINNSWGIPEYNTFGTDEFLDFCRQIGAQPQIALNLGSGSPEEAAGWVSYVDRHWSTHSGLLWELGNELWGNWNLAYPMRSELASRTLAYSKAIHAVDPSARLIATGADPDDFQSWNAIQLTNPPGTYDDLSTHFVVTTSDVELADPLPDFVASAAFALPVALANRLYEAQKQIDDAPGYRGKAHLAFTEWLFIGRQPDAPNFTNMGGAVVAAGFLNMLIRNSAIVPVSDMTGIMEFGGIWKKRSQVFGTPSYYAFKLYATADAARTVAVDTQAGSYSVAHGARRAPNIDNVPYLDVVGAVGADGKTLTLFCVNRSLATDIEADIRLHDFGPAHAATIQTLQAANLATVNDETNPTRVVPAETVERIRDAAWTHTFPRSSVTVISLHQD